MWTALTLAAMVVSSPGPPFEVGVGTRVRLTAAQRVDPAEILMAPGATVEGTLVGADPVWLHIRRSEEADLEKVHRPSVARVHVLRGKKRASRKGSLIGLGVGAAAGVGLYASVSGPHGSDTPRSAGGFLVSAAVPGAVGLAIGALIGLAATEDDWQEVPLGALPGAATRAPAHLADRPGATVQGASADDANPVETGGFP